MNELEFIKETLDRLEAQCRVSKALLEIADMVHDPKSVKEAGLRPGEFQLGDFIVRDTRRFPERL